MPEATIYEDHQFDTRKNHVRGSRETFLGECSPPGAGKESAPPIPQCVSELQFRLSVSRPYGRHVPAPVMFRQSVGHYSLNPSPRKLLNRKVMCKKDGAAPASRPPLGSQLDCRQLWDEIARPAREIRRGHIQALGPMPHQWPSPVLEERRFPLVDTDHS